MSKDKACISAVKEVCQRCPLYKENCGMLDFPDQCSISGRYIDGYEQAEKDIKEGIWHKSNESPIIGKTILLVVADGSPSLCLWNGKSLLSATIHGGHLAFCEGDKWCYIEDI